MQICPACHDRQGRHHHQSCSLSPSRCGWDEAWLYLQPVMAKGVPTASSPFGAQIPSIDQAGLDLLDAFLKDWVGIACQEVVGHWRNLNVGLDAAAVEQLARSLE